MKNLHFYIQSAILILGLSIAVLIPFEDDFLMILGLIELVLGGYQLLMSWLLMARLRQRGLLLKIYFGISISYLAVLMLLGFVSPEWMTEQYWLTAIFCIPWLLAMFFLIVIDDLEWKRNYRL